MLLQGEDISKQREYINFLIAQEDMENLIFLITNIEKEINTLYTKCITNLKTNKIEEAHSYYTKLACYYEHFRFNKRVGKTISQKYNEAKKMLKTKNNMAR